MQSDDHPRRVVLPKLQFFYLHAAILFRKSDAISKNSVLSALIGPRVVVLPNLADALFAVRLHLVKVSGALHLDGIRAG